MTTTDYLTTAPRTPVGFVPPIPRDLPPTNWIAKREAEENIAIDLLRDEYCPARRHAEGEERLHI